MDLSMHCNEAEMVVVLAEDDLVFVVGADLVFVLVEVDLVFVGGHILASVCSALLLETC